MVIEPFRATNLTAVHEVEGASSTARSNRCRTLAVHARLTHFMQFCASLAGIQARCILAPCVRYNRFVIDRRPEGKHVQRGFPQLSTPTAVLWRERAVCLLWFTYVVVFVKPYHCLPPGRSEVIEAGTCVCVGRDTSTSNHP